MKNRAEIHVTAALLQSLLKLPEGVQIIGGEFDVRLDRFAFILDGPGLPEVPEGGLPMVVSHEG
ncbi:MAG TPA: hypothetical protein VFI02_20000 [Armatimonadota bacterium]|nr:hypothetical protein [Armatimonadota bacterium]